MYDVNDALSLSPEEVLLLSKELRQYMKINFNTHIKDWYPSIYSLSGDEYLAQVGINMQTFMFVCFVYNLHDCIHTYYIYIYVYVFKKFLPPGPRLPTFY